GTRGRPGRGTDRRGVHVRRVRVLPRAGAPVHMLDASAGAGRPGRAARVPLQRLGRGVGLPADGRLGGRAAAGSLHALLLRCRGAVRVPVVRAVTRALHLALAPAMTSAAWPDPGSISIVARAATRAAAEARRKSAWLRAPSA